MCWFDFSTACVCVRGGGGGGVKETLSLHIVVHYMIEKHEIGIRRRYNP